MYIIVSLDAKEQVLANLSNFSYDPINYSYLRSLNVIDIFLDLITSPNYHIPGTATLVHYALAGLCNLCLDKENKEYILSHGGVEPVTSLLLNSHHEETVLNAITTLMFLVTPQSKPDIIRTEVLVRLLQLTSPSPSKVNDLNPSEFNNLNEPGVNDPNQSGMVNPRISNLVTVFLGDLCSEADIQAAREQLRTSTIPLPDT